MADSRLPSNIGAQDLHLLAESKHCGVLHLEKKGILRTKWVQKYVMICKGKSGPWNLICYEDCRSKKASTVYSMKEFESVAELNEVKVVGFTIRFEKPSHPLVFSCDTPTSRKDWIRNIDSAIRESQNFSADSGCISGGSLASNISTYSGANMVSYFYSSIDDSHIDTDTYTSQCNLRVGHTIHAPANASMEEHTTVNEEIEEASDAIHAPANASMEKRTTANEGNADLYENANAGTCQGNTPEKNTNKRSMLSSEAFKNVVESCPVQESRAAENTTMDELKVLKELTQSDDENSYYENVRKPENMSDACKKQLQRRADKTQELVNSGQMHLPKSTIPYPGYKDRGADQTEVKVIDKDIGNARCLQPVISELKTMFDSGNKKLPTVEENISGSVVSLTGPVASTSYVHVCEGQSYSTEYSDGKSFVSVRGTGNDCDAGSVEIRNNRGRGKYEPEVINRNSGSSYTSRGSDSSTNSQYENPDDDVVGYLNTFAFQKEEYYYTGTRDGYSSLMATASDGTFLVRWSDQNKSEVLIIKTPRGLKSFKIHKQDGKHTLYCNASNMASFPSLDSLLTFYHRIQCLPSKECNIKLKKGYKSTRNNSSESDI